MPRSARKGPIRRTPATLAVVAALADDPREWQHGYELMRRTALRSGSLYPILMRLAERGLVEAKWEDPSSSGRPPRHLYRLTAAGRAFATQPAAARARGRQLQPRTVG